MPYDVIHKHGVEPKIHLKMNKTAFKNKVDAQKWRKTGLGKGRFLIVPHSKIKSVGGGLYKYNK